MDHRRHSPRSQTDHSRRLALAEEAMMNHDDEYERRRRSRHRFLRHLRYPTFRVRLVYGALLLVVCYSVIFPAFTVSKVSVDIIEALNEQEHDRTFVPPVAAKSKARADTKASTHNRKPTPVVASDKRAPLPAVVMQQSHPDHKYVDGRLIVNPNSKVHPIYQLIRDARRAWDAKVAKQSTTLKEAVDEYKRRYKRAPPVGFDKWWRFVKSYNVQLPDEYDQIHKDLELFWGLSPADLKSRILKSSQEKDTYTITVRDGALSFYRTYAPDEFHDSRAAGQLDFLDAISHDLPNMMVVYSVHDTPNTIIPWDHREDILEHIEEGEFLDANDQVEATAHGWASACPNSSKLRREGEAFRGIPSSHVENKSFIQSHTANMDICNNPDMIPIHGLLAGRDVYVRELSATFCLSKTSLHTDVLGVPPERIERVDAPPIPWEQKQWNRLLWRGTNTGILSNQETPWRLSQRMRLIGLADTTEGQTMVLSPPGKMHGRTLEDSAELEFHGDLNPHYTDMGFVDAPLQCDQEDKTCDEIALGYSFLPRVPQEEFDQAKYLIDVDGNAWSARFQRLMASGSLVFKSTALPEWWNDRVQPWVHYVPVKLDYTDLYDSLSFFRGDMNGRGKGGEDDLARDIGMAGREWSEKFYRTEDMIAYVFRLYLEWARLQAPNRSTSNFVYDPSMEV